MFDKKTLIIAAVLLLIGFAGSWYVFRYVSDDASGTEPIRADIQRVADTQSAAIRGLDSIAGETGRISDEIGSIESGIKETAGRITESQNRIGSSSELIAEGRSILAEIRARGKIPD